MSQPLLRKEKFAHANPDLEAQLQHAVLDTYSAVVDEAADDLDEDAAWLREQRVTHRSLHWLRRPLVIMIGLCLFLFAFATSSAESTRQMVTFKLACNYVLKQNGSGACDPTSTQVLVSGLQQAYAIAGGITTLFALGKIGPLSDQYGRRIFIILIGLLQSLGKLLRYLVMTRWPELQFGWMVVTEIIANMCGGVITLVTLSNCYVSDIAEAHQRTYYLGINIAMLFVGLSTGPLAGNLLLSVALKLGMSKSSIPEKISENISVLSSHVAPADPVPYSSIEKHEFVPLKVEIGILLTVLLFVLFVLPELRSENARRKSRSLSRSLLVLSFDAAVEEQSKSSKFFEIFNFLRPLRLMAYPKDLVLRLRHNSMKPNRLAVVVLIVAECMMTSISMPMGEIYVLYGIFKFGWTAQNLGVLLAVACLSRAFALVVVSPLISKKVFQQKLKLQINTKRFDHVDYAMIAFSFLCEFLGMVCLSFAPTGTIFLSLMVLNSLGALANPALNSAVVKFFPELKIGELFGAIALLKNVLQVIVPVALLAVYKGALTRWQLPQIVFLSVAGFFLFGVFAVLYVARVLDKEDRRLENLSEPVQGSSRLSLHHHRNSSFS